MRYKSIIWLLCLGCLCLFSCGPRNVDISRIKAVSKLASLEVTLDKMLFAKKETKLFPIILGGIPLNESSFIAYTEAEILIGVDLEKLQKKDIEVGANKIKITLPPIELLSFSYPASSFQEDTLYVNKNNFPLVEREHVYQMGEMEIRAMLPYLGLEERAEQKLVNMLSAILREKGFQQVEIDFKPAKKSDFKAVESSIAELKELANPN